MIDDVFIANHFSTSPSEGVGEKSASFVVTETWLENLLEISTKLKSGKRSGICTERRPEDYVRYAGRMVWWFLVS